MKLFRRFTCLIALGLAVGWMTGCPTAAPNTPPAALAPGYMNSADQTMGETLAAAHAFYARIQSDAVLGSFKMTDTEKTAMNALAISLNAAQPVYIAYHNGAATQAQAQAAVNDVSAKQAQVQALGVK